MPGSDRATRILEPGGLSELLEMRERFPGATLVSGATYVMRRRHPKRRVDLGATVISLRKLDELRRITRSERYLEIGSAATLNSIIETGAKTAPPVFVRALRTIGSSPIRNRATLGGNICVPETRLSAFPVLLLLDGQVELRKTGRSRWLSISRFVNPDGTLNLEPEEVCTRVRVPLGEWNIHEYRRNAPATHATNWSISFVGVAETRKGVLSDLRFVFGSMGKTVLRVREIEAELRSRKLPLPRRDRDGAVQQLELAIDAMTPSLTEEQRATAVRYLEWFLVRLNTE